jgi:hypothetical protein
LKNKEDEEEILSHMTSFTLRSKVRCVWVYGPLLL